jgi:protein-S-isoprenylcysteine O-methyltransferase Ste14
MTPAPHLVRTIVLSLAVLVFDVVLLALGVGGIAALLHHPRALALLATWLIATPTLALLRPVRSQDPVVAHPDRAVMLALFLIPLLTPILSALAERSGAWLLPGGAALRWGGVALSAAGLALRIMAMRQLGSRFSPLIAVQREHTLETRGLYGAVRHPGYLGAWICNLGIVLAFGSALTLPLVVFMALAYGRRVAAEERLLEQRFGTEFRAYRAQVGGFLPRIGTAPGPRGNP